jgi:virginiamycin B lyase
MRCFSYAPGFRLSVVVALLLGSALLAYPKAPPPTIALAGLVTSDNEGPMEGVLVTAKREGGNITITVISDDRGRYVFPAGKLEPGKHTLAIRAVGYKLSGQSTANIESDKTSHVDIKLVKVKDVASQLTGAEWMVSIPGSELQKRALFRCDQCHSLDTVVNSTYDAEGWLSALPRMQFFWLGNSTITQPSASAHPPKAVPVDPELAKYLSSINLSGRTSLPYELKTFLRPRGADTRVIITEYELPRSGSMPHDVAVDHQGAIWYTDFRSPDIGKLDPGSGKVKEWPLPLLKPGLPQWSLAVELDPEGNPWIPRFYQGCAATKFDVKTEKFETLSAPAEYNDDRASCSQGSVSTNGMIWLRDSHRDLMLELNPKTGGVRAFDSYPFGTPKYTGPSHLFYFGIDEKFGGGQALHDTYGIAVDSKGDPIYCDMGGSNIAVLDHTNGQVSVYPTPTPNSAPRRGTIDLAGRFWFGEWMASQVGMFDPKTKEIKEWRPPTPWSGLYRAAADKNGEVWSGGMSTDYVYRLNPATGEWREYLLPTLGGEIRDIKVDDSGKSVKVWVPLVHAGIIAEIEPLE